MKRVGHLLIGLGILLVPVISNATVRTGYTAAPVATTAVAQGRNTIYGTVFGESRRPMPDVYVELTDDFYSSIGRAKTDPSGRFSFSGLVDGRYKIVVKPVGTDYLEQTQEVTLASVASVGGGLSSGSASEHVDITLRMNERFIAGPFAAAPAVIFAQDIPPAARKPYEEGVAYLRAKKEKEGFDSLKKALEIFPDYYLALDRLGAEYAMRGTANRSYLEAGFLLLTRAVQVNPRGFSSLFGLGWAQYQLGLNSEAIESLKKAIATFEKAADAHLWLGKALRRAKTLDQAETAFKRANVLTGGKVADIHWQLAALYSDQNRFKEAADEMELFLKASPKGEDAEKIKGVIKQLRDKAAAAAAKPNQD